MEALKENPPLNPLLLQMLNQCPCVTWILDLQTKEFNFVSSNTLEIFGHDSRLYQENGLRFHESIIHAEDMINTWALMHKVWKVLASVSGENRANYRFCHDYRIRKPDGSEVRILEQNSILQQNSEGQITHLLSVCIDITQWKKAGPQLASVTSVIDQQYFLFTNENTSSTNHKSILSKRELEIIKLISQGHSSKYIADKLFISFHTVNTHRQKMIEKTNTKNTGGLVQFASLNGLI